MCTLTRQQGCDEDTPFGCIHQLVSIGSRGQDRHHQGFRSAFDSIQTRYKFHGQGTASCYHAAAGASWPRSVPRGAQHRRLPHRILGLGCRPAESEGPAPTLTSRRADPQLRPAGLPCSSCQLSSAAGCPRSGLAAAPGGGSVAADGSAGGRGFWGCLQNG